MPEKDSDQESIDASNSPVAAATPSSAAASSAARADHDMTMAQAMQMVETLTSLFGFSYDAANEAVNVVGAIDVQACCDYILDQGLGVDGGGAIAPKDDCPHLQHTMLVSSDAIPMDVFARPCCYYASKKGYGDQKMPAAACTEGGTCKQAAPARLKDDIDESTGVCPAGENWMCLTCGDVYCSRYVNGHGLCHWEETAATHDDKHTNGHCVLVSFTDLSVWCNACGAYLVHKSLQPVTQRLQEIKFPEEVEQTSKKIKSAENALPLDYKQYSPSSPVTNTSQTGEESLQPFIMPSPASSSKPVRQCPCKLLPRSFSSFTAAEYGDLHTLAKFGPTIARRQDDFGYTPLHLAAQNNHVAATALLLQLGCHVDGIILAQRGMESEIRTCGATPLHRAAFSGATAAMKLLLEWNSNEIDSPIPSKQRCDLLTKDMSFGDESTPLHKAAAGGRYLAVHMLLEALKQRQTSLTQDGGSLLKQALDSTDKSRRTPLDVARQYLKIQDSERNAVARWDEVAGGAADWSKCVQLLNSAAKHSRTDIGRDGRELSSSKTPRPPMHLTTGVMACLNCDDNGQCLTASWEAVFQRALVDSAGRVLEATFSELKNMGTKYQHATPTISKPVTKHNDDIEGRKVVTPDDNMQQDIGAYCCQCSRSTITLYLDSKSGQLVCKRCRR